MKTPGLRDRYVIYYFFANAIFYTPVLLLHFQSASVTPSQAIYLVSIYSTVVAISELPSGILADVLGLRLCLVASLVLGGVGAALFVLGSGFWVFALGQFAVALGLSASSGTSSAYLYELCQRAGLDYAELEGRATSVRFVALGGAGLLGSRLFSLHYAIPFWLTCVCLATSLALLTRLPREERPRSSRDHLPWWRAAQGATRSLLFDRRLMTLTAYVAAFFATRGLVYWFAQPYMQAIGIPTAWFGAVYVGFFLASGLGSRVCASINRWIGDRTLVLILGGLLGASILAMGFAVGPWGVALLVGIHFLHGCALPICNALILGQTTSGARHFAIHTLNVPKADPGGYLDRVWMERRCCRRAACHVDPGRDRRGEPSYTGEVRAQVRRSFLMAHCPP
jgi:predicted MFS family arabinose efflux permease